MKCQYIYLQTEILGKKHHATVCDVVDDTTLATKAESSDCCAESLHCCCHLFVLIIAIQLWFRGSAIKSSRAYPYGPTYRLIKKGKINCVQHIRVPDSNLN